MQISPGLTSTFAIDRAMSEGVDLNNSAHESASNGYFNIALERYKLAIEIKIAAYGRNSLHVCISLSELADTHIKLKQFDNARVEI